MRPRQESLRRRGGDTEAVRERLQVSDTTIFYEVVGGNLVRSIEPVEISYFRFAEGGNIVFCLHSLGAAARTFAPLGRALDGEAAVVAADLRGFGDSRRPTQDYTVETWVEDAEKVLAAAAPTARPIVAGHGLGACVALALAARVPVAGLALSGVALAPGEPAALTAVAEAGDRGEDVADALGSAAPEDMTAQIVSRCARTWQAFDGRPLARPGVPLVVLGGDDDALTPLDAEGGGAWLAAEAGSALVRLPGGHDVYAAHAEACADAIRGLIREVT